jgi:hypothetical protein
MGWMNKKARSAREARWAELGRRIEEALRSQGFEGTLHDPIEDDERYKEIIERADREAEKEVHIKGRGSCHVFWSKKERILRKKYGILWFSPAEMNPKVLFD